MTQKSSRKPRQRTSKTNSTTPTESKEQKASEWHPQRIPNPGLPTIWVDNMHVLLRSDVPVATLSFYTTRMDVEEGQNVESARIQTTVDHVKRMIDALCRATGHYPQNPEGT